MQKLILASQLKRLISNANETLSRINSDDGEPDHKPVIKLFCPWGAGTWLLTEIDENNCAYGLVDLGYGASLGYVDIDELRAIKHASGLKIERDIHFSADKPLSEYVSAAKDRGSINV